MHDVLDRFPAADRRGFRWLGVDQALRLRLVKPDRAADLPTADGRSDGAIGPALDPTRPREARRVA
jgi:hypothetical protein